MSLTVHMGDVPIEFDTSQWNALIGAQLHDAFDYESLGKAKATLIKIAMKMLMHEALEKFTQLSLRGTLPIPPPDRERADEDVLAYGASYILAFLIGELEKLSFIADYEEGENGAIRITGLHAAPALGAGESIFLAAGPENGPDDAEAGPAPGLSQPGESERDSGECGGYVDAGGDEGQRQDLCRETGS